MFDHQSSEEILAQGWASIRFHRMSTQWLSDATMGALSKVHTNAETIEYQTCDFFFIHGLHASVPVLHIADDCRLLFSC